MLIALFLAVLVGLALGLLGGGGSLLSVVALSFALGMPPRAAISASLLIIGVTSTAALLGPHNRSLASARIGFGFGGASMLGAFAGGRLSWLLPEAVLLTGFGVVMLLTSFAMLRPASGEVTSVQQCERASPSVPRLLALAVSVGVITGLLGAGGGFLIVPALVLQAHLPMKRAVATSLLVIALQSFAGFLGHVGHSNLDWAVVMPFTLMAAAGAIGGGELAKHAPPRLLRSGFAVVTFLVGVVILAARLPHSP